MYNETLYNISGDVIYSKRVILNEKGNYKIKLNLDNPAKLHILVAHPRAKRVSVSVLKGNAEMGNYNSFNNITRFSFDVSAGMITLGLKVSDPELSVSPGYVTIKQEVKPRIFNAGKDTYPSISGIHDYILTDKTRVL